MKRLYFCILIIKHRHSFLNGYGRPRTAFFVIMHERSIKILNFAA
jgi:hypothetical protein